MKAFVIVVPERDRELAADRLFALGVAAVEERPSTQIGAVELWTEVGDDDASIAAAVTTLAPQWAWRTEAIDEAVADTWRQFAQPTWVDDDLVIVPDWLPAVDAGEALVIRIDPGAAFGMGDHPTTQLTLRSLVAAIRRHRGDPPSVLDVGCGSGVLAVTAALLGAPRVVAIDISTAAVEATRANAAANGVGDVVVVSTTALGVIAETFDIVLANILAPVLTELATELRAVTRPAGSLVISGVLARRHQPVLDALRPMTPTGTLTLDGWAAVTLNHPQPS